MMIRVSLILHPLVFGQAGVDLNKPMVAMCGSGMTACWVIVAGLLCGAKTIPLYDVSCLIIAM